jgi:hypothetical protein
LDGRLTALLCKKKITIAKTKEVKPGRNLAESSKEVFGFKMGCFANDDNGNAYHTLFEGQRLKDTNVDPTTGHSSRAV